MPCCFSTWDCLHPGGLLAGSDALSKSGCTMFVYRPWFPGQATVPANLLLCFWAGTTSPTRSAVEIGVQV